LRMGINRRIKYTLALIMTFGTVLGGLAGYALCKKIFIADPAGNDIFISSIIALWLIVYSFIIIPDFPEAPAEHPKNEEKKEGEGEAKEGKDEQAQPQEEKKPEPEPEPQFEDELYPDEEPWEIARSMRSMKLPPYIKFPSTLKDEEEDQLEPAEMRRGGEEPDLDTAEE
ncbi:TSUP family transporter, partial [Aduncisulcus paluster]